MKHCKTIKEAMNCKNTKCDKRRELFEIMAKEGYAGIRKVIEKEYK
jgi:hypothetical protein